MQKLSTLNIGNKENIIALAVFGSEMLLLWNDVSTSISRKYRFRNTFKDW